METHEENVRDRYHAIPPASVFGDESVAANRLWTGFTNRLSLAADVWKLSFIQRLMRVDQKLPVRDGSNNLLNSSTGLEISSPADTSTVSFPIWAKADVHKRDEAQQGSENSIFGNLTQTTILPTPLPMDAFLPVTSNSESRISAPSTNDLAIGEVSHVADPPPSGALSDPPFRTVPSPDFPSQTTSSPPLPLSDDCKQCFIIYKYVSVYYPPATSSNTDCLTNGAEMPSPSLPPGLEP